MKIISEEFSIGELTDYYGKKSYAQYKTVIDIGDEEPWRDVTRKVFELDSPEFKSTMKSPEDFIKLARKTTQAIFFRYIGKKLFKEWGA